MLFDRYIVVFAPVENFTARSLTWLNRKFGNTVLLLIVAEHDGHALPVCRCVVMQLWQNVWPQGVTNGSVRIDMQIGHSKSSSRRGTVASSFCSIQNF
jgi:hypothetical protein